jgi:hypothetical protein
MSLRNRRIRERRQRVLLALAHTAKWVLVLGALGAVGLLAHRTGSELALTEVVTLTQDRDAARAEAQARQDEAVQSRAAEADARDQAEALRQRIAAEVPTGQLATLLAAVRARLEGGLSEALLAHAIRTATPPRICDGAPIVRRFRITAGDRPAQDDGATFFEGLVRVQAAAPAGFEALSRTMVVTFSGLGLPAPVTITGSPAMQTFRIGQYEAPIVVTVSPIAGFAAATVPGCRPD